MQCGAHLCRPPLIIYDLVQVQAGEAALPQVLRCADLTGEQLPWDDTFAVLDNDQRPADVDVPRTGALCHLQLNDSFADCSVSGRATCSEELQ